MNCVAPQFMYILVIIDTILNLNYLVTRSEIIYKRNAQSFYNKSIDVVERLYENVNTDKTPKEPQSKINLMNNDSNYLFIKDALKNVAYYLRAHKFNEYDRRFQVNGSSASREYFSTFPKPPLRSLHWEVHKFCETSFATCVEYLNRRIRYTGLKRIDDTSIVIQEQKWNYSQHSKQIDIVEIDCRKMKETDDVLGDPFQGPIERFQWRTTASCYMCWYTTNEIPQLKHLNESCDNFANCLDPKFGVHNLDPRADDNLPYSCALYSFCPDPCCPFKHLSGVRDCWESSDNPCFANNILGEQDCTINRLENTNFKDIVLNRWNVTCQCPHVGFKWDSKYGMCVDIDECLDGLDGCNPESEACVNLPGSFRCVCRWGFVWNASNRLCQPSLALDLIKLQNTKIESETQNRKASSIVKFFLNKLFGGNGFNPNDQSLLFVLISAFIAVYW